MQLGEFPMNPMTESIQLKAWAIEEAKRQKVTPSAIRSRMNRGNYPALSLIRINRRVIFVDEASLIKK